MNINYVKKYSNALGRDMEYKTYGDKGHPVLSMHRCRSRVKASL